jgi:hypothetical protein
VGDGEGGFRFPHAHWCLNEIDTGAGDAGETVLLEAVWMEAVGLVVRGEEFIERALAERAGVDAESAAGIGGELAGGVRNEGGVEGEEPIIGSDPIGKDDEAPEEENGLRKSGFADVDGRLGGELGRENA